MPVPFWLRWASGGWDSIKRQTDRKANAIGAMTYSEAPHLYRFHGWGLDGLNLACNVTFCPDSPDEIDLGRIVA
jgi:hypothetical protein